MALEVLVVDDEADIRELVSGVLEDEGYSVRTAADSTAALDAIDDRRPSMVLLDVWLQGSRLDGLQLLQEIKRRDAEPAGAGDFRPRQPRHRRRRGPRRRDRLHREAVRGRAAGLSGRPLGLERLLDEVDRAFAHRGDGGVEVAVPRNHQHRQARVAALDLLQ